MRVYRRNGFAFLSGCRVLAFGSNRPSLWHRWQRHMANVIYIALHNAGLGDGEAR